MEKQRQYGFNGVLRDGPSFRGGDGVATSARCFCFISSSSSPSSSLLLRTSSATHPSRSYKYTYAYMRPIQPLSPVISFFPTDTILHQMYVKYIRSLPTFLMYYRTYDLQYRCVHTLFIKLSHLLKRARSRRPINLHVSYISCVPQRPYIPHFYVTIQNVDALYPPFVCRRLRIRTLYT